MSISYYCLKKFTSATNAKTWFFFKINVINKNFNEFNKLDNKKINVIDVKYDFYKCFDKISGKSNDYINESFKIALKIITQNKLSNFINGPISKKYFLKGKTLGITEYLAKKTKKKMSRC